MNWIRRSTLLRLLGLALLAACFNAGHASAQVFQGKFTLPFEARWGQATLPAGDYSFTLDSVSTTCALRLHRGNNNVALIPAQAQDENYSGHAELTVVGGTVRALSLPGIGVALEYAPQHHKYLTAPEERKIAQIVPVATTGK
ncbi:MAG: hypothetical protein ABSH01_01325 [Terriglobia bacterium]|jgi:hypothetical protein